VDTNVDTPVRCSARLGCSEVRCGTSGPVGPQGVFEWSVLPDHSDASCHGSRSSLHRGGGQRSQAQVKESERSWSLPVRCWRARTIHGRSGSCSVIVDPVSRTNLRLHRREF